MQFHRTFRVSAELQQAHATGPVTAITNARIYPISSGPIERGTIVIRGNRIEAVGANVAVPAGAQVIDAKGGEVYPGFIDARTTIGLNEPGPRGFEDSSEMLEINASVKAQVAYQSDSDAIPVARVNGITSVAVVPSGGLIGGQVAVMNLDGWTWEEATLQPVAGVSFQFPPVVRGGGFGGDNADQNRKYEDLKKERDARVQRVEDLIARARAYARIAGRRARHRLEPRRDGAGRRAPAAAVRGREQRRRHPRGGGLRRSRQHPHRHHRRPRVAAGGAAAEGEEHPRDSGVGVEHAVARGRASCGHLQGGRRAGAGGRHVRVRYRRRGQQPAAAVRGGDLGRVGPRSQSRAARHHARCGDDPRRRRSRRLARARQDREPVHRHRRSDGNEDAVHAHLHQRPERRVEEQTHRAVRTLHVASGGEVMTRGLRLEAWGLRLGAWAVGARGCRCAAGSALQLRDHRCAHRAGVWRGDRQRHGRVQRRRDHRRRRQRRGAGGRDHDRRQGPHRLSGADRHGQHRRPRSAGDSARREPADHRRHRAREARHAAAARTCAPPST